MVKKNTAWCVDAGTENCPCFLALTGDCLTCSRLQNKDYCDCDWKGACIYNEFMLAGKRVNNPRQEKLASIVEKIQYEGDLNVYILDVGKGFAIKSSALGSYIFMKNASDKNFYDVPISIMMTDPEKGWIYVAVKTISTKTKMLAGAKDEFIIRGPYRNGIIGVKKFEHTKGKTLIICRGVGISPAIFAAGFLCCHDGNCTEEIHMIVDTERTNTEMALDYLPDAGKTDELSGEENVFIKVKHMKLVDPEDELAIRMQMRAEKYEKVGIFTSDYFISRYGNMAKEEIADVTLAISNNFNICCGEGICGACTMINDRGEAIKMCKCQLAAEETFRRYEER